MYINKPKGSFLGLPLIVFCFMSHHSMLELLQENHCPKTKNVRFIILISVILLALAYISIGVIPYLVFGNNIIVYNYENILTAYEFKDLPMIFCNALVIVFVIVNKIHKFEPAKDILTCLLRERYRESRVWNVFIITVMHLVNTMICCFIVRLQIGFTCVCYVLIVLSGPIICQVFPFLAFHIVFYHKKDLRVRRLINLVLMFLGLFIYLSQVSHLFMIFLIERAI